MSKDGVRVSVRSDGREEVTDTRSGEPWLAAARRLAAPGEPVPIDLSGPVKQFEVAPDRTVSLRAMAHDDLDLVTRWREGDGVRRWWQIGHEQTLAQIQQLYAERIDGRSPTQMWMVELGGQPVGFVQDYLLRDYPEYAVLAPDADAVGVDYAIGADEWRGRGLGPVMLWAWLLHVRERRSEATTCFAAPDHRNHASCRVLAKAGFEPGVWFDQPQSDGSTHTMVGHTLDVLRVLGGRGT